jgi:MOSC domain-containing protein
MKLSRLFVYPVKSLAGVELTEAEVDEFGIAHDRRWLVIDDRGESITQRADSRLALIRPSVTAHGLQLRAPGMSQIEFDVPEGGSRSVRVWDDVVCANDAGAPAADWLSTFLQRPAALVHMPDSTFRRVDPRYSPQERRVSFADAYPFLVLTQESMDELNRRLAQPLRIERFRPNLVISGAAKAHAEDGWSRIRLGSIEFDLVKPCARCAVPTVDPQTGERGKEPTRTLSTYRKRDGKVWFGMNALHRSTGRLTVSSEVSVGGQNGS